MNHPFNFQEPTDKMPGGWHGAYLKPYAMLFEPIKDADGSVLEIGVDGGGSLLMYADYFTKARTVVGMDISPCPECIKKMGGMERGNRIQFLQADAYSPNGRLTNNGYFREFILQIDDGPHTIESQKVFCQHYPTLLAPNGIAIVEDVQSVDHFKVLSAALLPEFFGYGIDLRMHDGRYDNLLFVITRR